MIPAAPETYPAQKSADMLYALSIEASLELREKTRTLVLNLAAGLTSWGFFFWACNYQVGRAGRGWGGMSDRGLFRLFGPPQLTARLPGLSL
jgi:hypothetical protein